MAVYQSHNVSLFLSFRVLTVLQSVSQRRIKWQYTSLIMFLLFLSFRVLTVLQSVSQRRTKWQYTSLKLFLYFFHLGFGQCNRAYHRGE